MCRQIEHPKYPRLEREDAVIVGPPTAPNDRDKQALGLRIPADANAEDEAEHYARPPITARSRIAARIVSNSLAPTRRAMDA